MGNEEMICFAGEVFSDFQTNRNTGAQADRTETLMKQFKSTFCRFCRPGEAAGSKVQVLRCTSSASLIASIASPRFFQQRTCLCLCHTEKLLFSQRSMFVTKSQFTSVVLCSNRYCSTQTPKMEIDQQTAPQALLNVGLHGTMAMWEEDGIRILFLKKRIHIFSQIFHSDG
jgi:hypothetical protein